MANASAQASAINSEISVQTSNAQRQITIIEGEAAAKANTIINLAEATIKDISINSQTEAYTNVATLTGFSAGDILMDYIYYTNFQNLNNATLLIGVNDAQVYLGARS